ACDRGTIDAAHSDLGMERQPDPRPLDLALPGVRIALAEAGVVVPPLVLATERDCVRTADPLTPVERSDVELEFRPPITRETGIGEHQVFRDQLPEIELRQPVPAGRQVLAVSPRFAPAHARRAVVGGSVLLMEHALGAQSQRVPATARAPQFPAQAERGVPIEIVAGL